MFLFIIGICVLALFMPVLRFLFGIAILAMFFLIFTGGTGNTSQSNTTNNYSNAMTYEQLKNYPVNCLKKTQQLEELNSLLNSKNFDSDPEKLAESDRIYNSRLKATIWWYTYSCE